MRSRFAFGARASPFGLPRHFLEDESSGALVEVFEDKADLAGAKLVSESGLTSPEAGLGGMSHDTIPPHRRNLPTYLREPSPKIGVIQKDISPELCQLPGGVPGAIAQSKIPDHNAAVAVIHTRRQSRANFGTDQLLFDVERKLCAHLVQLRPAGGRDRDHGQVGPVLRLPLGILFVGPAEDDDAVGVYAALRGYGVI